ncbi:MAG: mannitol-1-phosphate 5-dehydrogenase [Acidobacteriota bacterium]|nr:mannitol-1-phosphate 5-dehydrogenase [Acidobacteriota bacterium]
MEKLVQFGAGNIGRSFIGQLFSRAGWEVVFVEVDAQILRALNERRQYTVEIRDENPESLTVRNVRGVDARDTARVAAEVAGADCLGTAVGKNILGRIIPNLAEGLQLRFERHGIRPVDLIICENILDGASFIRSGLLEILPPGFPLARMLGLVETSIGKMVPIMPPDVRSRDPLLVYAEAYNTLICDGRAFVGRIPGVAGLDPKDNMKAYVERKSFIHNLGHAMIAYLEFIWKKGYTYTWEAVRDRALRDRAEAAMWESGKALINAYPAEFDEKSQGEHIENLLRRFGNVHLGDTIYRVGRDVQRKLARDDRLIGAMRFDLEHGVEPVVTAEGAAAACFFRKRDEQGKLFEGDGEFADVIFPRGIDHILSHVCGLRADSAVDGKIMAMIKDRFAAFQAAD